MRLRISNETRWSTRDIRKLVVAGLKAEGQWGPGECYMVRIRYSRRSGGVGGWGFYNRNSLMVAPPKLGDRPELPHGTVMEMARVLIHEIGHNTGLTHKDMVPTRQIQVPWAEGLRVRAATVKPKPTPAERADQRAAHVTAKIEYIQKVIHKTQRREKVLAKQLTEWRKKERYYQRKAASPKVDSSSPE